MRTIIVNKISWDVAEALNIKGVSIVLNDQPIEERKPPVNQYFKDIKKELYIQRVVAKWSKYSK